MKKLIAMMLSVLMLASLASAAFAEEDQGLTPDMVLSWLDQGEDASETVDEQAANGALRLAEMMIALANVKMSSQEELDRAEGILDELAAVDTPDESNELKLAAGTVKTLDGLLLISDQLDPDEIYVDYVQSIVDDFRERNESMDNGKGQAVNALYQSMRLAALLAEENCTSQEMIDQIESGLTEFANDDDACVTVDDQLANGSRWLYKMLSALTKLRNPEENFLAEITAMVDETQELSDGQDNSLQQAVIWLYGCVKMSAKLAEALQA